MHINDLTHLSSQSNQQSVAPSIDIKHYLHVLWQRKFIIVFITLVFGVWGFMNSLSQKPFYTATLTLLLEEDQKPIVRLEDIYMGARRGHEYVQTQFGILRSRKIAEQVVRKSELHKHPFFTQPQKQEGVLAFLSDDVPESRVAVPEEQQIKSLIGMVAGGVGIGGDDSRILRLSFTSQDPDISILVVNTLADVYIEDQMNASIDSAQKATTWLTERLETLYLNLKDSEAQLQQFRESEQLIDIQGGVTAIGTREYEDLTRQYTEARAQSNELESLYQQIKRSSLKDLVNIPSMLSYPSVSESNSSLIKLKKRKAELAKRYGPKHPKMIALEAEIDSNSTTLITELANVSRGISLEYEQAKKTENARARQLAQAKGNLQDINRKEFKLQELQREVNTNLQLYEMFFQRVKETTDASGFVKPHARVLDRAEWASASRVNRLRGIIMAMVIGGVLVVGVILAIDFLDDKIRSPMDAQERLHMPFLGIIPVVRDEKGRKVKTVDFPYYWQNTQSAFSESIRTIRTGVVLESLDSPAKTIVVTSTLPAEGKSTVALNLAAALGQMESVLLIGADLRRPTLAAKLKMDDEQVGLSDYLAGTTTISEAMTKIDDAGVYVLPAGSIPTHPLEMLSSPQFKNLIERFGDKFDRIIIDSAPTHAVSDALVLASLADTVLYVVKANETPAKLIKQGLKRLRETTEVSVGVVLNDFDESKVAAYSGGGYYYNGYYSGSRKTGHPYGKA